MKTRKFRGSNWGTWFLYAGACNLGNKEAIDMHITVLFQVSVPKLSCSSIAPPKFTCLHFRKVLFKSCSHYFFHVTALMDFTLSTISFFCFSLVWMSPFFMGPFFFHHFGLIAKRTGW